MDDNRNGGATGKTGAKIEQTLEQGVGKLQNTLGKAKDEFDATAIVDRASSLVKQAAAAGESAASVVEDVAHKAGARTSDFGARLYEEGRRAGQSIGRAVEEQPFRAVLIAAAVGYGFAYLLHRR